LSIKPIYDITSFTTLDYPGYLAAIIWFQKCNMRCQYCYNPQIVFGEGKFCEEDAFAFLQKRKGLLDGVVFSGGEATLYNGLFNFAKKIKEMGFLIKLDTNGLLPNVIMGLVEQNLIDFISLDFKAMFDKFKSITQNNHFDLFENTLHYLIQKNFPFEVRTTIHVDLLNEKDVIKMIDYLWEKGYQKPYYLQNFLETDQNIGNIKAPTRLFDRNLLPQNGNIIWRNESAS